jgi:hypothetical protein
MAEKPTKPKRKHVRTGKVGRMPRFVPTEEQRRLVASMAGFRMSREELAWVIINPRTREPISVPTLLSAFKTELKTGRARLKTIAQTRFLDRLNHGDWNAIYFALRFVCGYRETIDPRFMLPVDEGEERGKTINIQFVSGPGQQQPEPIDVTPQPPSGPPKPYQPGRALPPPATKGPYSWMD